MKTKHYFTLYKKGNKEETMKNKKEQNLCLYICVCVWLFSGQKFCSCLTPSNIPAKMRDCKFWISRMLCLPLQWEETNMLQLKGRSYPFLVSFGFVLLLKRCSLAWCRLNFQLWPNGAVWFFVRRLKKLPSWLSNNNQRTKELNFWNEILI